MTKRQKIYKVQYSSRITASTRMDGELIGLTPNQKVYIFEKDNVLLYSHESQSKEPGFTIYKVQVVEGAGGTVQVTIPAEWIKKYCKGLSHVKATYTETGLFIKPDRG